MQENQYTSYNDNQRLKYEILYKNSDGDLVKIERVFLDMWNPGVEPDVVYTQIYEQCDASGVAVPSKNVIASSTKVYNINRTAP